MTNDTSDDCRLKTSRQAFAGQDSARKSVAAIVQLPHDLHNTHFYRRPCAASG